MFKLIVVIACLAYASATEIQPCASGVPTPTAVRVEGCEIPPCTFVQGTTVTVEADHTADFEITEMTIVAKARIGEAEIVIPVPEPDACAALIDESCPVAPNTPITVGLEVFIDPIVPPMEAILQVSVLGPDGEALVCFEGAIVVVPEA